MLSETVSAILSGSFVGFSLGLLGGGGSILATPLLLYWVGLAPHVAIGTGAVAVSINAYVNFFTHARNGRVWWKCAGIFAFVGSLGAFLGSTLGKSFDSSKLLFLFGVMMVVVGVYMLRSSRRIINHERRQTIRSHVATGVIAALAGIASGFFGIGGGFLIVPSLIFATGMPTINAAATSLLAVGTFGLATATNYAVSGLVDWRTAAEFVLGGMIGGFAGMLAATRISASKDVLHRYFAILIFVVAAYVIYRSGSELAIAR